MKSENKKIGVDIDDTLLDFVGTYILYHNQFYIPPLKKEDFKSYAFNQSIGETMEDTIGRINKFYEAPLFNEVLPLPNSVEIINLLKQKGYELFVITSRPDFIKNETEEWINKYFPEKFSNIFFSYNYYTQRKNGGKSKAEICFDLGNSLLIDDSLEYINQCVEKGVASLLFGNFPWNQNGQHEKIIRVKDWVGVKEELLK